MESNIIKEEAIKRHRIMWNWIADETLKKKAIVYKEDAFEHFGWDICDIHAECWCCEYAKYIFDNQTKDKKLNICKYCPIDWPGGHCVTRNKLYKGLYDKWKNSIRKKKYKKSYKLAKEIANLPERKD